MPDLSFRFDSVDAVPYAAIPTIAARLHLVNSNPARPVHSIVLNCQVQIETLGRSYTAAEEAKLLDLFCERERWARTMKPMLWTNTVIKVPGFATETSVDLLLPCTLDFEVASTKYFYGLQVGNIPITVMFSGTIFYVGDEGAMQVAQIPWDREARFSLPVETWRAAIDAHYPRSVWLRISSETFDRLYQYKIARGAPMWDQVIEKLLDDAKQAEGQESRPVITGRLQ
ncbi:MAG TPA: DUF6084 family protein [Terracidiphilus sp.]|jgi:hypothetical protein